VRTTTAERLVVDSPFVDRLVVGFLARGAFPPTRAIDLSVRHVDAAHGYTIVAGHSFTGPAQLWEWSLPLMDATLREYELKVDVTDVDGSLRTGEWTRETETSVVVGPATTTPNPS